MFTIFDKFLKNVLNKRNLLKWRTKLRAEFKQSSAPAIPKLANGDGVALETPVNLAETDATVNVSDDEDDLETEIKDALYTEKKIDKK